VVFIVPGILIIVGISLLPFLRTLFPVTIKNGVTAEATVLSVWDTGVSINDNPQVGMLLDVRPTLAPAFQAEAKKLVSRINTGAIQPGMKVQVLYDPANPKRIEVQSIQGFDETQAAPGVSTTEMRLKELSNLKEKDLISRDEYDKKREEILKNL
jgi:translation elongation factor EF-1alpha